MKLFSTPHCDDYIDDKTQPPCLRRFLKFHRWPAAWQYKAVAKFNIKIPKLFADFNGKRFRVVMASRLGDVGLTSDLNRDAGYDFRVSVNFLTNFSDEK